MKSLFITIALLVLGISIANGQTRSARKIHDAEAEREVRKLEREWLRAYDNNDVAAMKRIVADGFTITYGDGRILNKAETIGMLRPGSPRDASTSQWTEDSKVRVYGNTAIIVGRYLYKNKETLSQSSYTDTYIKLNGRWHVVASHLSAVKR